MKKLLMILSCAVSCIFADESTVRIIDLGNLTETQAEYIRSMKSTLQAVRHTYEFNGATDIGDFVQLLQNEYQIEEAVETGTYIGHTSFFLSYFFDQVYTAEISTAFERIRQLFLQDAYNVHSYLISSDQMLINLLPALQHKKLFFYLDAHLPKDSPLLDELEAIYQMHIDDCAIMIDDVKVPMRPEIHYNVYNGNDCCYAYFASKLSQIFPEYDCYYIIPQNIIFRAKFLAIPKSWTISHNATCGTLSSELQNQ